jgi:hypothetical protein
MARRGRNTRDSSKRSRAKPKQPRPAKQAGSKGTHPKLKPLSQLSPRYRRRIERYAARHKLKPSSPEARQRARGHFKGEAKTRRQREKDRVTAFAEMQTNRGGNRGGFDAEELEAMLWEQIAAKGYGWFGRLERFIRDSKEEYVDNMSKSLGRDMTEQALMWGLPAEALFYH